MHLTNDLYESILDEEPEATDEHEARQALAEGYSAARYAYAWTAEQNQPFSIEAIAYRTGTT